MRPLYAAVTHIEPLDADNQRALGLDAYAIPTARDALSVLPTQACWQYRECWPWRKTLLPPQGTGDVPAHLC